MTSPLTKLSEKLQDLRSQRNNETYKNLTDAEFGELLIFACIASFGEEIEKVSNELSLMKTRLDRVVKHNNLDVESLTIENDFLRLCRERNYSLLSMLLDADKTDEIVYDGEKVPLSVVACKNGWDDIMKLLHEKKRKVDSVIFTVEKDFIRLCEKGDFNSLSLLLDIDPTDEITINGKKYSLSVVACKNRKLEIMKFLHKKNRKFDAFVLIEAIENDYLPTERTDKSGDRALPYDFVKEEILKWIRTTFLGIRYD